MKQRVIVVFSMLCLFGSILQAQTATINIKGHVFDETTNQPVGKDIDMVIQSKNTGKKYVTKVNSKSGEYLQPLSSGDVYTITFSSYAVFRKQEVLDLPPTPKYREEKHDYKVRSIIQGQNIASVAAFDAGQHGISAAAQSKMNDVLEIVKQNRDLNVVVRINLEQIPPPPPVKKDKTVAKKTKGKKGVEAPAPVAESAPQPVVETDASLFDHRVETLKAFFAEAKSANIRITYEKGPITVAAPGQENVVFVVGVVKSILED